MKKRVLNIVAASLLLTLAPCAAQAQGKGKRSVPFPSPTTPGWVLPPVESYLIRDLVPHIDATYRTLATRAGRMIEGFSMGGSGAAKLGFKYPELFGAISIFAGALHTADSLGVRKGSVKAP